MSRRTMTLVLAVIAFAPHPTRAQGAAPAQIAGCYTVSIGLWSPPLGSAASRHAIPISVRLETTPTKTSAAWRLTPNIQYPQSSATPEPPSWRMVGDDVRLTWTDGVTLTIATLIPDAKELVGEAVAVTGGHLDPDPGDQWWIHEPPGPRAPALFERRPCGERARRETSRPWSADSALAARVSGCYQLDDGWKSDSALAQVASMTRGPVTFELTDAPDPNWTRLSADARRTYFETRSSSLFSSWVRVSDTEPAIVVSRPLAMAGVALHVKLRGADLVGTLDPFSDTFPSDWKEMATHAVTARRVTCSARRE